MSNGGIMLALTLLCSSQTPDRIFACFDYSLAHSCR